MSEWEDGWVGDGVGDDIISIMNGIYHQKKLATEINSIGEAQTKYSFCGKAKTTHISKAN